MKKQYWHLSIFIIATPLLAQNIGITYKPWTGRLGDNLFYIGKCLVLSHKYKIPFYYRPFEHSEHFLIHTTSQQLTPEVEKSFTRRIKINHEVAIPDIKRRETENTLIIIDFKTPVHDRFYDYCKKHPGFYNQIKELFSPRVIPEHEPLPSDIVTVAVHVRKGSFIDGPLSSKQEYPGGPPPVVYKRRIPPRYISDKRFPDKFPPDQYYIDAIELLSKSVQNQPLYIYIFTDYAYPQAIVEKYKDRVKAPNIIWADRAPKEHYKETIMHDFYFMQQFDCIIRPNSFFSMAAQILGNAKQIMYPAEYQWYGNTLKIKRIAVVKRGELQKK